MVFTNGREANREAVKLSEELATWVYVRKPNFRVEEYEVIVGRENSKAGDRAYLNGRAMPF